MEASQSMTEVRLVGRGGQGVVTAGELIGKSALKEGRWAQSLPTFGPERRGALTSATLRIGEEEVLLKCTTARPRVVLVLDATIWHHANVVLGICEDAHLVFNSAQKPEEVKDALSTGKYGYRPAVERFSVHTVDATGIALEVLKKPITNTAMMGAFVAASEAVSMASVESTLKERFGENAEGNIEAARAARERLQTAEG